jgi:hypothetical protein
MRSISWLNKTAFTGAGVLAAIFTAEAEDLAGGLLDTTEEFSSISTSDDPVASVSALPVCEEVEG